MRSIRCMISASEATRLHRSPPMIKQQAISALILAEVAKGRTIQEAFDAIIGEGAYAQLAGEVWEALQPA